MFKNGLDAEVEALREKTERELFLELGGEDMVDEEKVGLSVLHPRTSSALATLCRPATNEGSVPVRELSRPNVICDL